MPSHDIPTLRIALIGMVIAGVVVLAVLTALGLMRANGLPVTGAHPRSPFDSIATTPRLESAPQQDMAAYRAEKQRQLDSLAWVDSDRGIARIPIADAMALMSAKPASPAGAAR